MEADRLLKNVHNVVSSGIYELDFKGPSTREVATVAHDAAVNSLNTVITVRSTNIATGQESLVQMGWACKNDIFRKRAL